MKRVQPLSYQDPAKQLLLLLGEELKSPLVAITQLTELTDADVRIQAHARQALTTIDNVLLYQHLHSGQVSLALEPVHVGSALHDVIRTMQPIIRSAGCSVELKIKHGLHVVTADRRLLNAALQSLWQGFLGSLETDSEIVCKAYTTKTGVRIALQARSSDMQDVRFSELHATSSQPVKGIAGAAADVLTARALFSMLGSDVTRATSGGLIGLGVTLPISKQLQMMV